MSEAAGIEAGRAGAVAALGGRIARRGLPAQVVERIGRLIVEGAFPPLRALPGEIELTRELGVSRSVLREAIKLLAAKGMVSARPRAGTVVRPPEQWEALDGDVLAWRLAAAPSERLIDDLFELRQAVEPLAASLAAARATEGERRALDHAFRGMRAAVDLRESVRMDVAFHEIILDASHNAFLAPLGRTVREALEVSFSLSDEKQGARDAAMPLHERVLAAILARRERDARRAMTGLLEQSRQDVLWVVRTRRGGGAA